MRAKGKELSGFIASPLCVLQLPRVTNYTQPPEERYTSTTYSQFSDIGLMGTTFESAEFLFVGVQVSKWPLRSTNALSVRITQIRRVSL